MDIEAASRMLIERSFGMNNLKTMVEVKTETGKYGNVVGTVTLTTNGMKFEASFDTSQDTPEHVISTLNSKMFREKRRFLSSDEIDEVIDKISHDPLIDKIATKALQDVIEESKNKNEIDGEFEFIGFNEFDEAKIRFTSKDGKSEEFELHVSQFKTNDFYSVIAEKDIVPFSQRAIENFIRVCHEIMAEDEFLVRLAHAKNNFVSLESIRKALKIVKVSK